MASRTALVVDDSRVARMTLGKLLKAQGFEINEQGSAEEAMNWLQGSTTYPDIIFMDVMMGGMDGLAATQQIKANPQLAGIPVVICSGNDSEANLEKALASGAVSVLSKPPAQDALMALLAEVETEAEPVPAESVPVAEPSFEVDIDDLKDRLLPALKASLLPELEQQTRLLAGDISRQIAVDTVEKDSHTRGLSMLSEMTRQLEESSQQNFIKLKQSLTEQAGELVSRSAQEIIDKALEAYGLSEKLMALLRSEGAEWLAKQQQVLRETLLKQVQDELGPIIDRYLEQQLNDRVPALVKQQTNEIQAQLETSQQDQLSLLRGQLAMQRNIAFGGIAVAALALIVALL